VICSAEKIQAKPRFRFCRATDMPALQVIFVSYGEAGAKTAEMRPERKESGHKNARTATEISESE